MTSAGEVPFASSGASPSYDPATVDGLTVLCRAQAGMTYKYANLEVNDTHEQAGYTENVTSVTWLGRITSRHCYDMGSGRYEGERHEILMQCGVRLDTPTEDMRKQAHEYALALPMDPTAIGDIVLTYEARYTATQHGTFGWELKRRYDFDLEDDEGIPESEFLEVPVDFTSPDIATADDDMFGRFEEEIQVKAALGIVNAIALHDFDGISFEPFFPHEVIEVIEGRRTAAAQTDE